MKVKTSITLSEEVLAAIDRSTAPSGNRSELIERAVRYYLAECAESERNRRDLELINAHSRRLNNEALDAFAFQADL